ncbi:MAG: FAD-dependent oxidoreductase [Methanoregulaceae archaeon]|nr:FAD-dependent oxidoreductase [Methanoregulaceae archaeon]
MRSDKITDIKGGNKSIHVRTVILGGGLTGVTLARLLDSQGEEVVVLEAGPEIGGLCRSFTDNGFTFDAGGSHIIFSRDEEVLRFMQDVLGSNKDTRVRKTKILYKGRYIKYPFENGLHDLPKEDLFFCINEFVKALIAAEKGMAKAPVNFREWIFHTFGRGIAELYMVPYNEKIWKYPTVQMSHHWVEGRVPRPPVEDVIKSAIGIETEGYTHQAQFTYPVRGGINALVTAIAAPVRDTIITGFSVRSVKKAGNAWRVSDGVRTIEGDRCICTMPVQALLGSMAKVPASVLKAGDSLCYNSVACIFLGVRGRVPDISWLYIPEKAAGLENRVSFPSNYSTEVAPPGHGSILTEITYQPGDEVAHMKDEELIRHVIASLAKAKIIDPADVVYSSIARQRYAYVVYDLEYQKNIGVVRGFCEKAGIPLIGRFAKFEYLNMDGCIRDALDFVKGQACG